MAEPQQPLISMKPYKIVEIIKETPDVDTFRFRAEDGSPLDFSPGMFVMICHVDDKSGERIARAFSIASVPDSDTLEFYISMIHGRFTSKLDNAKVGDVYYFTGPHGQFKFDSTDKKVLFIAGGTGIAPFMSMLRLIDEKRMGTEVSLLYSVRFPNEIIRREELGAFKGSVGLKMTVTVTRPAAGDGWAGQSGHIDQDMIGRYVPDVTTRTVYICGPLAFVKAVKDALCSLGCKDDMIKADVWG